MLTLGKLSYHDLCDAMGSLEVGSDLYNIGYNYYRKAPWCRVSDQLSDRLIFGRIFQANERFSAFDLAPVCRSTCILFAIQT